MHDFILVNPGDNFDASSGFHDFEFVWNGGYVAFAVDGKWVWDPHGEADPQRADCVPVNHGHIHFNLWPAVDPAWKGQTGQEGLPGALDSGCYQDPGCSHMEVEHVAYYSIK